MLSKNDYFIIGAIILVILIALVGLFCLPANAAELVPTNTANANTIVVVGSPNGTPATAGVSANPAVVRKLFRTLDQVRADLEKTQRVIVAAAK